MGFSRLVRAQSHVLRAVPARRGVLPETALAFSAKRADSIAVPKAAQVFLLEQKGFGKPLIAGGGGLHTPPA
jgi:hypothetical protein